MIPRRSVVAGFLALLTVAGCSAPAAEDTAAAAQAVTAVGNRELAAFVSGNLDSITSIFTSDVVAMPPNEPTFHGRDSLRLWAAAMLKQIGIGGRYTASDVTVSGDWAIQRYAYALTMTPKPSGQASEDHGKGIHIYHRQPDGRWLIAQDIWNSDAPPPAPPKK